MVPITGTVIRTFQNKEKKGRCVAVRIELETRLGSGAWKSNELLRKHFPARATFTQWGPHREEWEPGHYFPLVTPCSFDLHSEFSNMDLAF